MSDALADKMKAAREILIGLNATDEQMNALADVFDFGSDTIEALRAENAKLREALKPFSDKARYCYEMGANDGVCVYVCDLRAARAAMGESDE